MSETRTIRLTAAQWRVVEAALMVVSAEDAQGMLRFVNTRQAMHKASRSARIALDKIRAAKGSK